MDIFTAITNTIEAELEVIRTLNALVDHHNAEAKAIFNLLALTNRTSYKYKVYLNLIANSLCMSSGYYNQSANHGKEADRLLALIK